MSESKDTAASSLLLFLLGAAVGAVVVALTTPKTGPELRSDLKDMGNKVKERVRRVGDQLRANGEEVTQG
jgi:gas vesicle protein